MNKDMEAAEEHLIGRACHPLRTGIIGVATGSKDGIGGIE